MRFSVDAHAIGRKLTGNEVYIRNLLQGFDDLDKDSEFIAYVSEPGAEEWVPRRFVCRRVARNPFVRLGIHLSAQLRKDAPDLLHVQYTAPLNCPVPVVVSVHDISFLERPEFFPSARALQLQCTVRRTIQGAARVLTPSEFSAQAIRKAYGLDERKVTVVANAVCSRYRPQPREQAMAVCRRLGIPAPFILMVGDLQLRKNQLGLVEAFEALLREHPELPHHLVLAGKDNWRAGKVHARIARSPAASRIHCPGFVSDDELVQLYAACDIFVFPSFYEGFGLPILEAMACGRAVACSRSTGMVEVADGAAIFFDPNSTGEIMRAMRDLLLDGELRARMERLGMQRASGFHWQRAAERTLQVYYEVAGGRAAVPTARAKPLAVQP